jgi:peptidoglycan hydrolase-like protein with peptidoglycan-binding domain
VPDTDPSTAAPWAESSRRSFERRERARRTRRNRWSLRAFAGVALASLTLASAGALAATSSPSQPTASTAKKAKKPSTRQIQRALGIKADGVMGPKTRRAIKRFQKRSGLKADGVVGPATLKALGLAGAGSSRTTSAPTGAADDRSLQEAAPADAATVLSQIAQCESGGDITAVSADGRYHGKYQFSQGTWEAYGGTGDPAEADEATQDAVAAKLYAAEGTTPWPACSQGL